MYFEDATKKQLLHICLFEDCPIQYKYEAARELQLRQWHDEYLPKLVRLWGEGKSSFQIAIEIGIEQNVVIHRLAKYGLYGRRVTNNKGA